MGTRWGVETADRGSFFSLDGGHGWVAKRRIDHTSSGIYRHELEVRMAEGHWVLHTEVYPEGDVLVRHQRLVCLSRTWFQDFVCRFRFCKSLFQTAQIAGRHFAHRGTNRWYQYPVRIATLHGERLSLKVKVSDWYGAGKFNQEMYVRDEPGDAWIVHARLMPSMHDAYWIRWDTRLGRILNVPDRVARPLLKVPIIKKNLWYRAERTGGRPNLQGQSLVCLEQGDELVIECRVYVSQD